MATYAITDMAGHEARITAVDDSLEALATAVDAHYQGAFHWRDTVRWIACVATDGHGAVRDVRIGIEEGWEVGPARRP